MAHVSLGDCLDPALAYLHDHLQREHSLLSFRSSHMSREARTLCLVLVWCFVGILSGLAVGFSSGWQLVIWHPKEYIQNEPEVMRYTTLTRSVPSCMTVRPREIPSRKIHWVETRIVLSRTVKTCFWRLSVIFSMISAWRGGHSPDLSLSERFSGRAPTVEPATGG